jgi:RHS repeat-associated protein
VTGEVAYDAFGTQLSNTDMSGNKFGFTGQWSDADGLVFLRARYYDSESGRFLSVDPTPGEMTAPLTLNAYVYCGNNPVLLADPSGEVWHVLAGAAIGGIGGLAEQFVEDVASGSLTSGRWSSASDYVVSAAGGLVAGGVTAGLANPIVGYYAGEAFKMKYRQWVFGEDPDGGDIISALIPGNGWKGLVKSYVKGVLSPSTRVGAPGVNSSSQIVGGAVWRTASGASVFKTVGGRYVQAAYSGGQATYELVSPPVFRPYTVGRPYTAMFSK